MMKKIVCVLLGLMVSASVLFGASREIEYPFLELGRYPEFVKKYPEIKKEYTNGFLECFKKRALIIGLCL